MCRRTPRRGFTNLVDALGVQGPLRIRVEPGHYRMRCCSIWGVVQIEAIGRPGEVVIDCGGDCNLQMEAGGSVVLRGLTMHNYHENGSALNVTRGHLTAEDCILSSITSEAVQA